METNIYYHLTETAFSYSSTTNCIIPVLIVTGD